MAGAGHPSGEVLKDVPCPLMGTAAGTGPLGATRGVVSGGIDTTPLANPAATALELGIAGDPAGEEEVTGGLDEAVGNVLPGIPLMSAAAALTVDEERPLGGSAAEVTAAAEDAAAAFQHVMPCNHQGNSSGARLPAAESGDAGLTGHLGLLPQVLQGRPRVGLLEASPSLLGAQLGPYPGDAWRLVPPAPLVRVKREPEEVPGRAVEGAAAGERDQQCRVGAAGMQESAAGDLSGFTSAAWAAHQGRGFRPLGLNWASSNLLTGQQPSRGGAPAADWGGLGLVSHHGTGDSGGFGSSSCLGLDLAGGLGAAMPGLAGIPALESGTSWQLPSVIGALETREAGVRRERTPLAAAQATAQAVGVALGPPPAISQIPGGTGASALASAPAGGGYGGADAAPVPSQQNLGSSTRWGMVQDERL